MPLPQALIDEFVAAAHGDAAKVQALLAEHPTLLHANASWQETAIQAAAQTGRADIAEFLLAHGAAKDICCATMLGYIEEVALDLHLDPSQANAQGAHGLSVLYHAAITGQVGLAQMLLDYGADLNAGRTTALHGAVLFNQLPMVKWLLAQGAEVARPNHEQKTPLALALGLNLPEIVAALRAHGAT